MFNRYFIIICLCFACVPTHAQSRLDSLLGTWAQKKNAPADTTTVNLLLQISEAYRYDAADTALYFAGLAEEYSEDLGFVRGQGRSLTSEGICYYIKGIYDLSLDAHSRALEIHQKVGNRNGMALSLNGISLVHLGKNDLPRAIEYQRKSISFSKNSSDSSLLANNYFNLGIAFDELGLFDSAYYYLEASRVICDIYGKNQVKLMGANRLAQALFHQGKYSEAAAQYNRVLTADYYQSNWESTFAHAGMAEALIKLGKASDAVEHGLKAVAFAEKVGAMWDLERAFGILSEAYAANSQFESAYSTHKRFKQLSDSILSEAKEKEINALMVQYHEAENHRLALVNDTQEEQLKTNLLVNIIISIVLFLAVVIAVIIYRSSRMTRRLNFMLKGQNKDIVQQKQLIEEQNAKLEDLNRTNALILSIISHDMRSPIASIQSMIELFRAELQVGFKDPAVFEELEKRIDNVASMLNNLLHWARAQFSGIKASLEPVDAGVIVNELLTVYKHQAEQKEISFIHQESGELELLADESQLRIVLQNLISNAIKFTPNGGHVEIFYSDKANMRSIHIKDTGVGMDAKMLAAVRSNASQRVTSPGTNNETGTGLGMMLVKQFVESNSGTITIESLPGQGTEFIVSFKKAS